MRTMNLTAQSVSPMLMHSSAGANPLDKRTQAHKALTSKRKKTEEDMLEIAESEFKLGLYFDRDLGVYIPVENVRACLIEGAKLNKLGRAVERGVIFNETKAKLVYDGPQTPDKLWEDESFRDLRTCVVGTSRVLRCRPIFSQWKVETGITFDPSVIEERDIAQAWMNAGAFCGLGNYRPLFGRFSGTTK